MDKVKELVLSGTVEEFLALKLEQLNLTNGDVGFLSFYLFNELRQRPI